MKRILYLTYHYPFPANKGEDLVFREHVKELLESKYLSNLKMFFSNFGQKYPKEIDLNADVKVFKVKEYKNTIIKNILRFMSLLFTPYSFGYHSIATKELKDSIKYYSPDIVILDYIASYKALEKIKNYKLIYITHNVETDFWIDIARLEKNILKKICAYINAYKIFKLEQKILKQADKIICISTSDYDKFSKMFPNKTIIQPCKIDISKKLWINSKEKTLFFCGPLDFSPNYDAVKWLCTELAPSLNKNIKIKVAGKGTDNVPEDWKKENVDFLGFVSKEELLNLYKNSSAFICPIIYGSGIKMKVTEALTFGTPIIATKEALEGLKYININPIIDRTNLKESIKRIENLLFDNEKIINFHQDLVKQINKFNINRTVKIDNLIDELFNQ